MDSVSEIAYNNRLWARVVSPERTTNTPHTQGTGIQRERNRAIPGKLIPETLPSGTAGH